MGDLSLISTLAVFVLCSPLSLVKTAQLNRGPSVAFGRVCLQPDVHAVVPGPAATDRRPES